MATHLSYTLLFAKRKMALHTGCASKKEVALQKQKQKNEGKTQQRKSI